MLDIKQRILQIYILLYQLKPCTGKQVEYMFFFSAFYALSDLNASIVNIYLKVHLANTGGGKGIRGEGVQASLGRIREEGVG